MFGFSYKLKTVYVSESWDVSGATSVDQFLFYGVKLVGGQGTRYNSSNDMKTYARIDNPPDEPGYFTYKASLTDP